MGKAILVLFSGALIIGGVWALFWWLWNTIAADIFGAPELSFWQAVGLLFLIGMITSGMRAIVKK